MSSVTSLGKVLRRELKHDLDSGSSEMPEDLAEIKSILEERFTIHDSLGVAEVKLVSSNGVTVKFDIRDSLDPEMFDTSDDEEKEEGAEESVSVGFTATIEKGDKTMRFRCSASEQVTIEAVEIVATGLSADDEAKLFVGPAFDELDQELQDAFHEYLAAQGVDDMVANFVAMYADFKEQQEYTKWLADAEAFAK
jgi:complement component 1 Q subcomponent-binding protein